MREDWRFDCFEDPPSEVMVTTAGISLTMPAQVRMTVIQRSEWVPIREA
jgi:hypothetical protein